MQGWETASHGACARRVRAARRLPAPRRKPCGRCFVRTGPQWKRSKIEFVPLVPCGVGLTSLSVLRLLSSFRGLSVLYLDLGLLTFSCLGFFRLLGHVFPQFGLFWP